MIRILLAEDHPDNREMLARRLLRRGYEVLLAEDGLQAVEVALRERPHIVLMDVSMPHLSGFEATRLLRNSRNADGMRIVALTAHAMDSAREEAESAGCDAFATKPVDFPALVALIERLTAGRGAANESLAVG